MARPVHAVFVDPVDRYLREPPIPFLGDLQALQLKFFRLRSCAGIFLRQFFRRFQRVNMTGGEGACRFIYIVIHHRNEPDAEDQNGPRNENAQEYRHDRSDIVQNHAQTQTCEEGQPLWQTNALSPVRMRYLPAEEGQRRMLELTRKPQAGNSHQHDHGHNRRLNEDAPILSVLEGRQAIGPVVCANGPRYEKRLAKIPHNRCRNGDHRGKHEIMTQKLALAVARCQKRADDGRLLFDGCRSYHHEYESHDHDNQVEGDMIHGGIALEVVDDVVDALVIADIEKVGDRRPRKG